MGRKNRKKLFKPEKYNITIDNNIEGKVIPYDDIEQQQTSDILELMFMIKSECESLSLPMCEYMTPELFMNFVEYTKAEYKE